MTVPNLNYARHEIGEVFEIPVKAGAVDGVRLGMTGWAPGLYIPPIHLIAGADTLHLRGREEKTVVELPTDAEGNATLYVDAAFGSVVLENFVFVGDSKSIVLLGASSRNADEPKPLWVEFHDCEFATVGNLDGMVKSAIEGYQAGVRFYKCKADQIHAYEHFAYLRGSVVGPNGHSIEVDESLLTPNKCSEIIKSPTRVTHHMGNKFKHGTDDGMWPLRELDNSRTSILVRNSLLHRRHRSSMEGGGVIMQDSDKDLIIDNSVIAVDEGSICVGLEAFNEGVGPDGTTLGVEPAGHPGNGVVVADHSTLLCRPTSGSNPILRLMSANGAGLRETGIYSTVPRRCSIEPDPHGQIAGIYTRGNVNNDERRAIAQRHALKLGWIGGGDQLPEPTWQGPWT